MTSRTLRKAAAPLSFPSPTLTSDHTPPGATPIGHIGLSWAKVTVGKLTRGAEENQDRVFFSAFTSKIGGYHIIVAGVADGHGGSELAERLYRNTMPAICNLCYEHFAVPHSDLSKKILDTIHVGFLLVLAPSLCTL